MLSQLGEDPKETFVEPKAKTVTGQPKRKRKTPNREYESGPEYAAKVAGRLAAAKARGVKLGNPGVTDDEREAVVTPG